MAHRRGLTIFRLRPNVQDFDEAIDPQALPALVKYEAAGDFDFDASLYVMVPEAREPSWLEFLKEGFGDDVDVADTVSNRAVVVVRFEYYRRDRYFAVTFGAGRYLLRRGCYDRGYGLKTALNVIYEDDDVNASSAPARIRRVDAKTVSSNTIRTLKQTNRYATFETFGLDIQRDLLGAVVGEPADTTAWGSRVSGADSVRLNLPIEFSDLGQICKRLWRAGQEDDYQERFDWIDNIHAVEDADLVSNLQSLVVDKLKGEDLENLSLSPPQLIDWDQIESFVFSIDVEDERSDLELDDFVGALKTAGKMDDLTIEQLRRIRVRARDTDGGVLEWSAFRCLTGEVRYGDETFLLEDGTFFELAEGYINELDSYLEDLDESDVALPASPKTNGKEQSEGDYNIMAANASPNHLLLDKETVKVATHTSPIEICDILTTDRKFVHVKRKLSSSDLSHLFSQGYVSGDLFLMSPEYRLKTEEAIEKAEAERAAETGESSYQGRFRGELDFDAPNPAAIEVVYAVVAKWKDRSLVEALPFFSKVNLRRHSDDLRRMGYKVSYKRVEVV